MLTPKQRSILKNKVAGCVYGFVIGDAMGATTEFMSSVQIQSKYGVLQDIIGGGWLGLPKGYVTDDTEMSMCVMRALESFEDIDEVEDTEIFDHKFKVKCTKEFIHWILTNPPDVGNQCRKAIDFARSSVDRPRWIEDDPDALGNGSLMRAMPCAILGRFTLNGSQSDITHPNDNVRGIVQKYSEVIWSLITNYMGKSTISDLMGPQMSSEFLEPTGHVVNTFNNALLWADKEDFDSCLIGAVNDGGDADTIAAIACSMSGARFGLAGIDVRHIAALDKQLMPELGRFINFAVAEIDKKLSK